MLQSNWSALQLERLVHVLRGLDTRRRDSEMVSNFQIFIILSC